MGVAALGNDDTGGLVVLDADAVIVGCLSLPLVGIPCHDWSGDVKVGREFIGVLA